MLNRAKHYINKHEGELKQSKKATDLVAKGNVYFERVRSNCLQLCLHLLVCVSHLEHQSHQTRVGQYNRLHNALGDENKKN